MRSSRSSPASASRWPRGPRSRPTITTSRRSTSRAIIRRATCRTRSTSRRARYSGRTPRRCRSAQCSRRSRRCGSSCPAASIAATWPTPRTRRCSTRSKGSRSTATSRWPICGARSSCSRARCSGRGRASASGHRSSRSPSRPPKWTCCASSATAQAADRLINAGVEVASVTPLAPDFRGVVAGEIEAIERELGESRGHRLLLCRVSTGRDRYSVVCGAPNTKVGARAPFAPPGAVLPGERKIAAAKIHGVESQGMLCSERELGLGEEHEAGLLLLDDGVRPGADLIATLGLDDHVLEVEITPNRPDCLSVLGIARELAALTGARLRPPPVTLRESAEAARGLTRALGLAGVMGGANTEVTDRTTRILLESAWFDPASIRRTSRSLSLRTAAAYRFERGADIEGLATASARAAALIAELAGGAIV